MESKTRFRTAGLLILFVCAATEGRSCDLPIPQTNRQQAADNFNPPHIVYGRRIVYPEKREKNKVIPLAEGELVTVACEGGGNILSGNTLNQPFVTGKCVSGNLRISNRNYQYGELGCKSKIKEELLKTTRRCGPDKRGTEVQIAWKISPGTFLPQIKVCHDASQETTYFTSHTLVGASLQAAVTNKEFGERPEFRSADNINSGVDFKNVYGRLSQISTFDRILGRGTGRNYIKFKDNFYLARGHLSPNADFIDKAGRNATFYYINAVPQWQVINNGNWITLENFVRSYAETEKRNLHIYTGTFDVLTFEAGPVHEPIFLTDKNKIPVPKIIWKVVHDPIENRAVAFVSVNNPYLTEMTPDYNLCTDKWAEIMSSTTALPDRSVFTKGYIYGCTVADLRENITYIPDNLDRLSLLKF